ncbi:T9SS type A sorting domain-containing protein [Aestuariivivens sediminis]|uniref:T9SS type A sorting domain-containing protein n=1 Tax=Aestuariivivens sediminis TaxID=2913557 RepID=UPI001F577E57|nr:T9SS type A sorting domain-containing protein [Aestuariivivens sediminis]
MNITTILLNIIFFLLYFTELSAQELVVFNNIPGRSASDHYLCRVKFESEDNTAWRDAFVLQTRGKEAAEDPEGAYYGVIRGFTASWIAFESDFNGDKVVVEISKKDGSSITKAMVRPVGDASPAVVVDGKAYVTFTEPANVNVDINGQMEENYTGFGYSGPKVHTITLFANPLLPVPDVNDPSVRVLQPNEDINSLDRASWQTIVFAPGVHDIGMPFQILSNEVLYIPGDAVVHGTIHPLNAWGNSASKFFKVYGSGTLSGENIVRAPSDDTNIATKPFTRQAEGAHLEGFVVADPAFHTFNMNHSSNNLANPNIYKNLKILAWRVNSDGINAFRNSEVSDCFFRTQDDAFYYGANNVNQHDNVVWNDANGAVLFLQNILDGSTSTFRDVKVIYHRAHWHWWSGGRIVSFRERSNGITISNVTVTNILVEDPLPAFPPFYATMIDDPGGVNINLNNILIENVHQEHDGVTTSFVPQGDSKPQNTMIGVPSQVWENIWFKDCYFNGKILTSFEDGNFYTEYVDPNTVIFNDPNLSTGKRIDFGVSIFPNPVKEKVIIKSETSIGNLTLYSLTGKLIFNTNLSTLEEKIDVSELSKGMYVLEVTNSKGKAKAKLLIN